MHSSHLTAFLATLAIAFLGSSHIGSAQTPEQVPTQAQPPSPVPAPSPNDLPAPAAEPTPLPAPSIRELPDGNVEVNGILVDRKARAVRFPARVNMDDGFVEYFLVTPRGKTHESVLVTDVQPNDLHIAMLLLGVTTPPAADPSQQPPSNIGDEWLAQSKKLTGDPVRIRVAFKDSKGAPQNLPAENLLVLGEKERKPAPVAGWIYTGSLLIDGRFLAQDEGSIIALIRDPVALTNNSLPEAARDDAWLVAKQRIPKEKSPVTVEIALPPPAPRDTPTP